MSQPRVAVYSPNGSISTKDHSHRAAWPKMVLDSRKVKDFVLQPVDSLANYDETWLYLGMEWSGALNLFGGASDENAARLMKILEAPNLYYLANNYPGESCPLLGTIAKARTGRCSDGWKNTDWESLDLACEKAPIMGQGYKQNLVVGDSHALSLYDGESVIHRHDHRTLFGALQGEGLKKYLPDIDGYAWPRVTFCFGNIDMQHHLVRLGRSATVELAESYVKSAAILPIKKIELMFLLPIFSETRKIAMTGWYKGRPWGGSWAERNELRQVFNLKLKEVAVTHDCIKILDWPQYIYGPDGEFSAAYQEAPKGVHLSWAHRRQTWPA